MHCNIWEPRLSVPDKGGELSLLAYCLQERLSRRVLGRQMRFSLKVDRSRYANWSLARLRRYRAFMRQTAGFQSTCQPDLTSLVLTEVQVASNGEQCGCQKGGRRPWGWECWRELEPFLPIKTGL